MTIPIDTFVVGAGLSGLILANLLNAAGEKTVVAEKSKGVGGRMATRRTDGSRFDHGAQFYTLQSAIEPLHRRWLEKSLVTHWFDSDRGAHFSSSSGMTSLAKDLAKGLDLRLDERVITVSKQASGWKLQCDSGAEYETERLVLTAPLPQSLELLQKSQIEYESTLDNIRFAKAIVALIEVESAKPELASDDGYKELKTGSIFSIADQKAKGLSQAAAITVTLRPEASETLYEMPDAHVTEHFLSELRSLDPTFLAKDIQIKRWRYSHPLNRHTTLYESPAPGLYLAGDAFGGASLNGAARSAYALADVLLTSYRDKES